MRPPDSRPPAGRNRARSIAMAGLCAIAAGPAAAAGWTPVLGLGTRLDDRRGPGGDPERLTTAILAPEIRFEAEQGRSGLRLMARRDFLLEGDEPRQWRPAWAANATDRASMHAELIGSPWTGLALEGGYLRSRDALDLDRLTALSPGRAAYWTGSGRATTWLAEGALEAKGWAYDAKERSDALAISWSAVALPWRGPDNAWLFGWRQSEVGIDERRVVRSDVATFGVRHRLSPGLSAQLEAGGSLVAWDDGARRRGPALAFSLRGPEAGEGLSIDLLHQPGYATNTRAEWSRWLGNGLLSARWESQVDAQGGIDRGPDLTRRLSLGARDTLDRATVIGLEASHSRSRPLRLRGADAQLFRASGWVARHLRQGLSARCGYSFLTDRPAAAGSGWRRGRGRVDAALTVVL
ncbi:MAG TPA: hypothetical protein VGK89_15055 [Candidatus Eisenbacteria bacterium]